MTVQRPIATPRPAAKQTPVAVPKPIATQRPVVPPQPTAPSLSMRTKPPELTESEWGALTISQRNSYREMKKRYGKEKGEYEPTGIDPEYDRLKKLIHDKSDYYFWMSGDLPHDKRLAIHDELMKASDDIQRFWHKRNGSVGKTAEERDLINSDVKLFREVSVGFRLKPFSTASEQRKAEMDALAEATQEVGFNPMGKRLWRVAGDVFSSVTGTASTSAAEGTSEPDGRSAER